MMKRVVVFCLFLLPLLLNAEPTSNEEYYDSLAVYERQFDTNSIATYRADSDFDYTTSMVESPSALSRFINWLLKKIGPGEADPELVQKILDVGMWVIVGIAVLILLNFVFRADRFKLFGKKNTAPNPVHFFDYQGDENQLDLDLEKAESDENYPLALRLLFIKTLHLLKQAGLLQWKKDKTNGEYLRELKNERHRTPFRDLSRVFEYVSYGHYPIKKSDYTEAQNLVRQLRQTLKGGRNEE